MALAGPLGRQIAPNMDPEQMMAQLQALQNTAREPNSILESLKDGFSGTSPLASLVGVATVASLAHSIIKGRDARLMRAALREGRPMVTPPSSKLVAALGGGAAALAANQGWKEWQKRRSR